MRLDRKRINTFRQGRINTRAEARKQLVLRNNLEKRFFKNLSTLFRKFVNVHMHLYKQYGIYEQSVATQSLKEDFFPLIHTTKEHFKLSINLMKKNMRLCERQMKHLYSVGVWTLKP